MHVQCDSLWQPNQTKHPSLSLHGTTRKRRTVQTIACDLDIFIPASPHTSGWTLLLLPQQQPWRRRLKPQQVAEVPSSHIAHLTHAATTRPRSPTQPPDTISSHRGGGGGGFSAGQRSQRRHQKQNKGWKRCQACTSHCFTSGSCGCRSLAPVDKIKESPWTSQKFSRPHVDFPLSSSSVQILEICCNPSHSLQSYLCFFTTLHCALDLACFINSYKVTFRFVRGLGARVIPPNYSPLLRDTDREERQAAGRQWEDAAGEGVLSVSAAASDVWTGLHKGPILSRRQGSRGPALSFLWKGPLGEGWCWVGVGLWDEGDISPSWYRSHHPPRWALHGAEEVRWGGGTLLMGLPCG